MGERLALEGLAIARRSGQEAVSEWMDGLTSAELDAIIRARESAGAEFQPLSAVGRAEVGMVASSNSNHQRRPSCLLVTKPDTWHIVIEASRLADPRRLAHAHELFQAAWAWASGEQGCECMIETQVDCLLGNGREE